MQAASSGQEELLSQEAKAWGQYRNSPVGAGSEKWLRYLEYMHGPFHQMLKTGLASSQQKSKADTDSLQHQLASASSRAAHAETRASQVRSWLELTQAGSRKLCLLLLGHLKEASCRHASAAVRSCQLGDADVAGTLIQSNAELSNGPLAAMELIHARRTCQELVTSSR